MQVEQRAVIEKSRFESTGDLWVPFIVVAAEGDPKRVPIDVDKRMRYAVVEDILDGTIVFEVSPWPRVDGDGRLVFGDDQTEWYQPLADAQEIVDRGRAETGVLAPDRPLRVGDAFAVRGFRKDTGLARADIWDISLAARNAAKAALYGAVASTVDPDYAEEMAVTGEVEAADPDKGEFDVAQKRRPRVGRPELRPGEGRRS